MRKLIDDRSRDREISEWICEKVDDEWEPTDVCFAIEKDGALVAGFVFKNWNGVNVNVHLRVDDKTAMYSGFLRHVFNSVFFERGVKRVTAIIYASNTASITVAGKLGFVHEATLVDFLPNDSLVFMVMFAENCRYLMRG